MTSESTIRTSSDGTPLLFTIRHIDGTGRYEWSVGYIENNIVSEIMFSVFDTREQALAETDRICNNADFHAMLPTIRRIDSSEQESRINKSERWFEETIADMFKGNRHTDSGNRK